NRLGNLETAAQFVERAVERAKTSLPAEAPLRLSALNELAETRLRQTRYQEAFQLFDDVHTKRVRLLGVDHEDTLTSEYGVAACMSELGDDLGAEKHIRPLA